MVAGSVAANTAIGRLEASMLLTATTSSITNSRNVPAASGPFTTLTALNIHAVPNRKSSVTKRSRQARR